MEPRRTAPRGGRTKPMSEQQRTDEPLDPKVDVVFKALFGQPGNMDLVADLLNGLLELPQSERIVSVELLPSLGEVEATDEKLTILDLYVEDARGRRYAVEMQCRNHKAFAERMLYYAARRYTRRLHSAEAYSALRPLVLVVITDFVLFPQLEGWRERFELRGRGSGVVFSPHLAIVLVELPKFHKSAGRGLQPRGAVDGVPQGGNEDGNRHPQRPVGHPCAAQGGGGAAASGGQRADARAL